MTRNDNLRLLCPAAVLLAALVELTVHLSTGDVLMGARKWPFSQSDFLSLASKVADAYRLLNEQPTGMRAWQVIWDSCVYYADQLTGGRR